MGRRVRPVNPRTSLLSAFILPAVWVAVQWRAGSRQFTTGDPQRHQDRAECGAACGAPQTQAYPYPPHPSAPTSSTTATTTQPAPEVSPSCRSALAAKLRL